MTTNLSTRTSAYPRRSKALGLALVSILAVVVLAGVGSLPVSASASTKFDTVQVFIQTSQDLPYSYTVTAYNTSGIQVAYYQSNFAAAALELPNGTYLFTVSASYSPPALSAPCIGCTQIYSGSFTSGINSTSVTYSPLMTAMPTTAPPFNESSTTTWANSTAVTNSTDVTVMPIFRVEPSSNEYGFAIEQIIGPSSLTINTQNSSAFPTSQVTVHVAYVNGTAAQGAWVYASVVGNFYYYGPNIVSGVQTGANGTAVLTMPQTPLLVTSHLSVPITLPKGQSNATVKIGGQEINVTSYWPPYSVDLEGQALVLPPQTNGDVTVQYQPQQYYSPIPLGAMLPQGVSGSATNQTAITGIRSTSQNAVQGRIPTFNPTNVQVAPLVNSPGATKAVAVQGVGEESLLLLGVLVALAVLAFAFVAVRGKRKPSVVSA